MLKNKHLKLISKSILLFLAVSLISQNMANPKTATARDTTIENLISSFSINEPTGETFYSKVDMDIEGNFAMVYKLNYFNGADYCNELKFTKYNKFGQPISDSNSIIINCDTPINDFIPDIAVRPDGQMAITWLEIPGNGAAKSIKTLQYNLNNSIINGITETVNDNLLIDASSVPKISINKITGNNYAIVWSACITELDCSQHNILAQTYEFNSILGPVRATPNNFQINTTNLDSVSPSISFSNNRVMAVWQENGVTNSTVKSRTFDAIGAPELETNELDFKYLNNAYEPSVTGVNRPHTGTSPEIESTFYTSWTEYGVENNNDIYARKINCEQITKTCNTANRAINENLNDSVPEVTRVNTILTGNQGQSVISSYKNQENTTKTLGIDNSSYDYIAIAWLDVDNATAKPIHAQTFKNNLAKIGTAKDYPLSYNNGTYGELDMAMNRDGLRVTTFRPAEFTPTHLALIERSEFLKYGNETLIHSPDPWPQSGQKTAMNSNGDYIITYQSWNGTDFDIIYALYDNNGNATKNLSIANETTTLNQIAPSVDYFNESSVSTNFGKFIITWSGYGPTDGTGVYYRIFNADGSPDGGEVYVAGTSSGYDQNHPSVSAGQYGQFVIGYQEDTAMLHNIRYFYNNNTNNSSGQVNTFDSPDYNNTHVQINPQANNNSISDSQFVIIWEDTSISRIFTAEGHLTSPTNTSFDPTNTFSLASGSNVSGAYVPALSTITPSLNPFIYGISFFQLDPPIPTVRTYTFGQSSTPLQNINLENNGADNNLLETAISIDKYTGNIFTAWSRLYDFEPLTSGNYLYLDNNNGEAFEVGTEVRGETSGGNGVVDVSRPNYLHFISSIIPFNLGEALQLTKQISIFGNDLYIFPISTANLFTIGSEILGLITGATGTIVTNNGFGGLTFTYNAGPPPTFDTYETVLLNTSPSNYTSNPLSEVVGQFLKLDIDTDLNTVSHSKFGPINSINTYPRYGEYVQAPSVSYYTSGSPNITNAVTTYNTDGASYKDTNGVYQQLITDPLNYGGFSGSTPTISQSINQGGKYIIVPSVIDFGTLARGGTGVVNFADLTPSYLQVTDLDGTDFDLTVSMTDLINTVDPLQIIDKSKFSIVNNDGINGLTSSNPGITTSSSFTDVNDVSLDSSTAALTDLSTNKTLLRKNNNNTGIWEAYPQTRLQIPPGIDSGIYSGTITFTLI